MDVKQGMSLALQEMRVDKVRHFSIMALLIVHNHGNHNHVRRQVLPLKPPKKSESALIRKRMAAKEREKAPTPIEEEQDNSSTSGQMSVENTRM